MLAQPEESAHGSQREQITPAAPDERRHLDVAPVGLDVDLGPVLVVIGMRKPLVVVRSERPEFLEAFQSFPKPTLPEVAAHLRGLVTQLRGVSSLDYTALFHDLRRWRDQVSRAEVRRRWGSQYFVGAPVATAVAESSDSSASAAEPVAQSIRL